MLPVPFTDLVMYASIIMGSFLEFIIEVCTIIWTDPLMLLALGICLVVGVIRLIQGLLWA